MPPESSQAQLTTSTLDLATEYGYMGVLFVVGVVLVCAVLAYLELRRMAWRRSGLLLLMRCGVLLALAFACLQPELRYMRTTPVINPIAILIDTSRSMSIPIRADGPNRLNAVQTFASQNDSFFRRLDNTFDARYFGFDSDVRELKRGEIPHLKPEGHQTAILDALRKVFHSFEDKNLEAVLLFTDGVDTTGAGVDSVDMLPHTPVHVFVPQEAKGLKDVAITRVTHDRFAFIRTPWQATLTLSIKGYPEKSIPLTLKQGERVILSRMVRFQKGVTSRDLTIEFTPDRIGNYIYTLSVLPYADELIHENNTVNFSVRVIRDKIRVLQICGRPSYDERFLRTMLKADPNIDLVSLFILRTRDSISLVPSSEMSLIPFPINAFYPAELSTFDLVIFQNFNYLPYQVAPRLAAIKDYVVEQHGGFLMLGGDESFSSGNYTSTPIADILPVELLRSDSDLSSGPFRAELTEAGMSHPITCLETDVEHRTRIWSDMPELIGYNKTHGPKPEAVTLLRHPSTRLPVLAVQDIGTGRTMAMTADTSWRWNFIAIARGKSNRWYHLFWKNAIRWLIRDPSLDRTRIVLAEKQFMPMQDIALQVRALDSAYAPLPEAAVDLAVINLRTKETAFSKNLQTDAQGTAAITFKLQDAGLYRVSATARRNDTVSGTADDVIAVEQADDELRDPSVNTHFLKFLAEKTGGAFITLPGRRFESKISLGREKKSRVIEQKSVPIWNNWITIAIIAGLLGLEWHLRRRNLLS